MKDIDKSAEHPFATKDTRGQLQVGAALGTDADTLERANALSDAGVDLFVVDSAHGHSKNVIETIKLIKMDPGTSVPLHSHNGKEYILVIDGSFCDEYGEYKKGDMQINDQKIKHLPSACDTNGCICLSITERDVVFFGKFASILNLFTFIKSFFK